MKKVFKRKVEVKNIDYHLSFKQGFQKLFEIEY